MKKRQEAKVAVPAAEFQQVGDLQAAGQQVRLGEDRFPWPAANGGRVDDQAGRIPRHLARTNGARLAVAGPVARQFWLAGLPVVWIPPLFSASMMIAGLVFSSS